MLIEISFGKEKAEVDLADGVIHVGGAQTDGIRVPGMAPALLTLNLVGERLMVTAAQPMAIGGVRFPAHVPRLVVPGERMQLPAAITLRQLPGRAQQRRGFKGTSVMLKELVGDDFSLSTSRAATLTCLTGLDAGQSFPVAMRETGIGRGEHCAVRIRDRAVSRRHARIVRQRSRDFLESLPDTNGLFLNGEPVKEATPLCPGDVIELGHSLLRYDGPEKALACDEKLEPTVLVKADEPEEVSPEQIVEVLPAPRVAPSEPERAEGFSLELLLVGAGAALAVLGLAVTISVCL